MNTLEQTEHLEATLTYIAHQLVFVTAAREVYLFLPLPKIAIFSLKRQTWLWSEDDPVTALFWSGFVTWMLIAARSWNILWGMLVLWGKGFTQGMGDTSELTGKEFAQI